MTLNFYKRQSTAPRAVLARGMLGSHPHGNKRLESEKAPCLCGLSEMRSEYCRT